MRRLHQKPADPQAITGAIKGVLTGLDPSVVTGMSPGLKSTILDIGQTVQNLPEANMGQLNSWSRQIDAAAQRERYPTDQVVAGKITSAFDDLMQKGGAGDLNAAAQSAAQKNIMAEKLAEWQEKVNAGAPLGQAPLTEAEWYKNQPDKQKSLVDLYQANQGGVDPSYTAAHLGSEIGGHGRVCHWWIPRSSHWQIGRLLSWQDSRQKMEGQSKKFWSDDCDPITLSRYDGYPADRRRAGSSSWRYDQEPDARDCILVLEKCYDSHNGDESDKAA